MIKIKAATDSDIEVLSNLGAITYTESHARYIPSEADLLAYIEYAFAVTKTQEELSDSKNLFFLIYVNEIPAGYAKLVLDSKPKEINIEHACRLERIYILEECIPLKIGQKLLTFLEKKAQELKANNLWLSVYYQNERAVRFYQKNNFEVVGELDFLVNGKEYKNFVFLKSLNNNQNEVNSSN